MVSSEHIYRIGRLTAQAVDDLEFELGDRVCHAKARCWHDGIEVDGQFVRGSPDLDLEFWQVIVGHASCSEYLIVFMYYLPSCQTDFEKVAYSCCSCLPWHKECNVRGQWVSIYQVQLICVLFIRIDFCAGVRHVVVLILSCGRRLIEAQIPLVFLHVA